MSTPVGPFRWSSKFRVAHQPPKLVGDKITLPQSALEALLAAAPVIEVPNGARRNLTSSFDPFNSLTYAAEAAARGQLLDRQQQLPHPLTFRIVNPSNDRAAYAGIREFSAEDGEIGLSGFLKQALGLPDAGSSQEATRSNTPNGDLRTFEDVKDGGVTVTVHAQQLPKATYVRLRPLEAGYDPEDWKSLLERYLRDNFTTLTRNELLDITGAKHEHFKFLVDKFEPDVDGVCIVDTDLEVDIEPLNEEQARESLQRQLAKRKKAPGAGAGSSAGGQIGVGQEVAGQVLRDEYVDYEVKLKDWAREQTLVVSVQTATDEALLDLFASPMSSHHRSRPRADDHVFADFEDGRRSKRLRLSPRYADLEEAEMLYISVHAWGSVEENHGSSPDPIGYNLKVSLESTEEVEHVPPTQALDSDEVICKNCQQQIPKRTLPLHEAFCYRNNIRCLKCFNVFLKSSLSWQNHWHCPYDDAYGSTILSRSKHNAILHPPQPIRCPSCDFQAFNLPILAQHRTTTCPGKEILCQFCHLIVPQQGADEPSFSDAEVLLSGLTPHELADGARTTECHLCNHIVRLRDMKTHLRLHDRERLTRIKPSVCINPVCHRTLKPTPDTHQTQPSITAHLGLCTECFGPLYVTTYDPEGKALRRRIERRLLQQRIGGCGKPWCHNVGFCKTANKNSTTSAVAPTVSVSAKDALLALKPVMAAVDRGENENLRFCVDQSVQTRNNTAGLIAAEGEYEVEWCVKALEVEKGDLDRATVWLRDRAPRIGETVK